MLSLSVRRPTIAIGAGLLLATAASLGAGDGDTAEPQARAKHEVEQLMNEGLRFAEKMLREEGEFIPFGAVRVSGGPVRIVGAAGIPEQPDPAAVVTQLLADLREGAQRREFSAVAVFANVEVPHPASGEVAPAVFVGLEHLEGYCVDVFFPYVRVEGRVELSESFAVEREGTVFGSCGVSRR